MVISAISTHDHSTSRHQSQPKSESKVSDKNNHQECDQNGNDKGQSIQGSSINSIRMQQHYAKIEISSSRKE
eukprot:2203156-Amphidinium_carterae.1